MPFFSGGFGVDGRNFNCALLGGLGERLGGESMLSKSFWLMPGGNGNRFRLFVVNVTMGGFGGSTDFNDTRLFGGLNFDMIVFGAGTGIGGIGGIGGGGTDMFGRMGVGGIGGTVIDTGTDIGGKTVDSADCGSGGGGGGGGCTPGAGAGKFGLCDTVIGQLLGIMGGLGELCTNVWDTSGFVVAVGAKAPPTGCPVGGNGGVLPARATSSLVGTGMSTTSTHLTALSPLLLACSL